MIDRFIWYGGGLDRYIDTGRAALKNQLIRGGGRDKYMDKKKYKRETRNKKRKEKYKTMNSINLI